jgi:iron complex outermembrane receptor protein
MTLLSGRDPLAFTIPAAAVALLLTAGPPGASAATPSGPARAAAMPDALETVTVTAQKVREDLQSAAAAVTVLGGEALVVAGVQDIRGAQNLVPSVRFQAENASTEIYVRGVGSTLDLPNIELPTSFQFEGMYIPREGTSVALFDVQQLELLPGPQGTLYGRSSLGGAVHVAFNRPTREPGTQLLLEAGNESLAHATLVHNRPVSDSVALRGAVDYIDHDGHLATGADSKEDVAARLSATYAASGRFDAYAWANYADKNGRSPNLVRRGYNGGTFAGDPEAFDTDDPWDDRISPDAPGAATQAFRSFVTGAELNWRLGAATLTWVPAWFELDWAADYWLEDIPAFLSARYEQVTQELRLASSGDGRWNWLTGLYAYRVTNSGRFLVGGFPLADVSRNRLEGIAAFGQATLTLGTRSRLTFGGRYSLDERQGAGLTPFGQPFDADLEYDRLDWKLGFELDVRDDALLYTTVQTAYQPGTYNLFPSTPTQSNEVNPARLLSWTVGSKNRLADDRAQLNVEAFYYDYRDLFVQSFNLNTALLTTFNAERVEIYGAQVDLLWRPVEPGQLNLSLGALHARNREFVVPPNVNIGTPRRDWAGEPLQYAPDWTVTAGYQHDFRADGGYLRARLETRYESAFRGTFTQSRGTRQGAYFKSDASLTWYSGDDRWSAGLWARNLENEPVLAATTTGQAGPYADAFLEPPRTWGARATLRF